MSIRYGIELALDPAFTSRVYRTRQLVCGQYSCWAAEMHMLRMQLVPYFECPEGSLATLNDALANVAEQADGPAIAVARRGITNSHETGSVYLEFENPDNRLSTLHRNTVSAVVRVPGVGISDDAFRPRIALLEFGGLPPAILDDATEYARAVSADLAVPGTAVAWRLLLLRYSSDAAGDDWSNGRWAADVGWRQLYSYKLAD